MQQSKFTAYIFILLTCCFLQQVSALAVEPEVIAKKILCHTCLMKIYVAQGKLAPAMAEYQELFKFTPNDAALHFEYGNFLARNSKSDLAVSQFKLAAKLRPAIPEYQVGLGNSLMYTKDYAGAVAAYTKACALGGKYQNLLQTAQQYQAQQRLVDQYKSKAQSNNNDDE